MATAMTESADSQYDQDVCRAMHVHLGRLGVRQLQRLEGVALLVPRATVRRGPGARGVTVGDVGAKITAQFSQLRLPLD